MKTNLLAATLLASSAMFAGQASAAIIYESATLGTSGLSVGGWALDSAQFLGSCFSLSGPTAISSIAGHIEGFGTLFGAIVALSGPGAVPVGSPFSGPEVLASGMFTASSPSGEQGLALAVTLGAGDYGVIFGSGEFGATGSGNMPQAVDLVTGADITGSVDIGSPSYFFWNLGFGPSGAWSDGGFDRVRFVVNGDAVGAIPEPETYAMMLAGLGLLGFVARRRKHSAAA